MITIILLILSIPSALFAWGPETHIKIALDILETTNFSLIKNHPAFFILGNIFPDFFNLFKDISIFKRNLPTHSWHTISLLFENSANDEEKAFSYGYSAHLAADIIAHNKMVPQHTLLNNKSRLLSHFLVELASISNEKKIRYILMDALENAASRGDVFLRTFNIEKKYFNRELFILKSAMRMQSVLKISEIASYIKNRRNPSFSMKCSIYEEKSLEMAKKSIENGFSELIKYDPSGKDAMKKAKEVRTKLLNNFSKKGLRQHDRENLFNEKFDPNRIID